jgi:thiol-disulfide isomerase/thioredoxin/mono/diheme cytochrome c family protein
MEQRHSSLDHQSPTIFAGSAMIRSLIVLAVASAPLFAQPKPHKEAPRPVAANEAGIGVQMPDFRGTTPAGKAFQLSKAMAGKKACVVAVTSTTCPLSKKYLPTLAKLEKQFAEEDVAFVYLNPVDTDEPGRDAQLPAAYLHDKDGSIAKQIGARTTTDVFLIDSRRTVVYRGSVDDQYGLGYTADEPKRRYLRDAIEALLEGKPVKVPATTAPGCELDLSDAKPAAPSDATYHNRISRIVQANCLECHRDGGVGPFPLATRAELLAHKGMIKKVVGNDSMPPWHAAKPEKGPSPFVNDRSLNAADKKDLLAWFENGAPEGNEADAPLPRTFPKEWAIGTPDLVVQLPKPVAIKATGTMPYEVVTVETNLDEDKWVNAVEVQPSAREVVHHVLVFALHPLKPGEIDLRPRGEAQGYFAAYVPGNNHQIMPEGFARKLPKGSRLRFQIHYTPNGKATTDRTRVGFRFAKEAPKHEIFVLSLANPKFRIPPGAGNHEDKAQIRIPVDAVILAYSPHMHVRGKACRYELETADGTKTTLLDVPHYDFNWQLQYKLAEPLKVSKGTTLRFTAWFDNSENNPANPDPKATVKWGPQTTDEMLLGYVEYYFPNGPPFGIR